MVITYHGISFFKIQTGDTTLVFDAPSRPGDGPSKKSSAKLPRFHADIILQSHDHPNHNGAEDFLKKEEFFIIDGPGEYEARGIYIRGLKSFHDSENGKKCGLNTIYALRVEGISLCFLGDFGEKELRPELKEKIGKVDVLFVPVAGGNVLEPESAQKFISQIEPAIAIPMHYSEGKKDGLKEFLAEMGQKDVKPIEKLSLKKKDIAENGTQVVVLSVS